MGGARNDEGGAQNDKGGYSATKPLTKFPRWLHAGVQQKGPGRGQVEKPAAAGKTGKKPPPGGEPFEKTAV